MKIYCPEIIDLGDQVKIQSHFKYNEGTKKIGKLLSYENK